MVQLGEIRPDLVPAISDPIGQMLVKMLQGELARQEKEMTTRRHVLATFLFMFAVFSDHARYLLPWKRPALRATNWRPKNPRYASFLLGG